jgi:predicted metal-dependent hydrolase
MKIEIDDVVIECDVQYSKRKKLSISIDQIGFITIKAPNNTSEEIIIEAIKQHGKLIKEKLDSIIKIKERPLTRAYDNNGKFLHLGKEYYLNELIEIGDLGEEELKVNLKKFYYTSCKKIVAERLKIY